MKKISLFIITLIVLVATVSVNAQTAPKANKPNVEFVFQLANNGVLTNEDVVKLQQFFNYQADLYDCDPQSVNLTAINLDENRKPTARNVVNEISQVGYAVMNLHCDNNKVYFIVSKSNKGTSFKKVDALPLSIKNGISTTTTIIEPNMAQ